MPEEIVETPETFNKEELARFIKEGVQNSIRELAAQPKVETPTPDKENPFQEWIDPIVNPRLARASLQAQSAEDRVEFYTSDEWLTGIDSLLAGDSSEEVSLAKKAIKDDLEKTFSDMVRAGKGTFRKDLLNLSIGKYIRENHAKVAESYVKRSSVKKEAELDKARRSVDMGSGTMSNFTPQDIHSMDTQKMLEDFGEVSF